jgi:hypothetical protein
MLYDDDAIIERLKLARGGWSSMDIWHPQTPNPPASSADLLRAETSLGCPLPSLLRRIYLEVGNGGIGPGYGLLPLFSHEGQDPCQDFSLVDTTFCYYDAPPTFLVICHWGCSILSCLDYSQPGYPVKRMGWSGDYEQHDDEDEEEYKQEAPSLQQWLQDWLDGRTLFNIYEKPAHPAPPPRKVEPRPPVMTPEVEQRLMKAEQRLEGILRHLEAEPHSALMTPGMERFIKSRHQGILRHLEVEGEKEE